MHIGSRCLDMCCVHATDVAPVVSGQTIELGSKRRVVRFLYNFLITGLPSGAIVMMGETANDYFLEQTPQYFGCRFLVF